MKYNKKGQGLIEFSLIGILVFCLSVVAVIGLGPSIGNLFSNNKVVNVFSGNRYNLDELAKDLITDITITVPGGEGIDIKSPLESYLQESLEETSGTIGDVNVLIGVIKQYIGTLEELVAQLEETGVDTSLLTAAIANYTVAIEKYETFNEAKVIVIGDKTYDLNGANSDLLGMVAQLDFMISFDGSLSQELLDVKNALPIMDSYMETLITAYMTDLIGLGNSIDYHVDSRIAQEGSILPENLRTQLVVTKVFPKELVGGNAVAATGTTTLAEIDTSTIFSHYDDEVKAVFVDSETGMETEELAYENDADAFDVKYNYDTGEYSASPSYYYLNGENVKVKVIENSSGGVIFKFVKETTSSKKVCIANCPSDESAAELLHANVVDDNVKLELPTKGYLTSSNADAVYETVYTTTESVKYTSPAQDVVNPAVILPSDELSKNPIKNLITSITNNNNSASIVEPDGLLAMLATLGSGEYDENLQEAVIKEITVYQGVAYTDAASNTYNDVALCATLGGNTRGGNCDFTNSNDQQGDNSSSHRHN